MRGTWYAIILIRGLMAGAALQRRTAVIVRAAQDQLIMRPALIALSRIIRTGMTIDAAWVPEDGGDLDEGRLGLGAPGGLGAGGGSGQLFRGACAGDEQGRA